MTGTDATVASGGTAGGGESHFLDLTTRESYIGLIVVVLSVISAFATYFILTGLTPIVPTDSVVVSALAINIVLIIAMIAVVTRQGLGLWRAWRDRIAGARLHIRIVLLFSVIAALPAILLSAAAVTTFSRSIDGWFSERTREIIDNSLDIAKIYVEENGQLLRTDLLNMARDINAMSQDIKADTAEFVQQVIAQAALRELPVAYIINGQERWSRRRSKTSRCPMRRPTFQPRSWRKRRRGRCRS